MHGQEIALEIEKRKGEKPSPGTIYPALKLMKENNFIEETHEDGKTITYKLTPEGKRAFREAKEKFCNTFTDVIKE